MVGCGSGGDPGPTGTSNPPHKPVIVADSSAVSFSVTGSGDSAQRTINITNAGSEPLVGMSVGVVYDAVTPNWLSARLSSPAAPAVLTLTAHGEALAPGTYHATARVNDPGASNSPLAIGVTLTVARPYTLSYGTPTQKVRVIDVGGTFAPTVSVVNGSGAPVTGVPLTFTSRATTVATVAPDGRITAVGGGDAWIVARSPDFSDSVFVIVPRLPNGPVIRTDAVNYAARVGDTLVINVVLDTRGTPVGAVSLIAAFTSSNFPLAYLFTVPAVTPAPVVNSQGGGVFRVSAGSASGFVGTVPLLTLKVAGSVPNSFTWLDLSAIDVAAVDGSSLISQTSSTRLPVVIR